MGDPRYSKLSDGTLMIENTLDSDAGVYECMAKSPVGEAKSRAAKMHYQKTKGESYISVTQRFHCPFLMLSLLVNGTEKQHYQHLPHNFCGLHNR
jgi:hypothetical protein